MHAAARVTDVSDAGGGESSVPPAHNRDDAIKPRERAPFAVIGDVSRGSPAAAAGNFNSTHDDTCMLHGQCVNSSGIF